MNSLATSETNDRLAAACQACAAACCRKGQIFLPEAEYQAIRNHLLAHHLDELDEFDARCTSEDGFRLYDQGDKCQFLDDRNLCRLHTQGVKPSECFWWPFHVYVANDGGLEIRLSTSCCDGYKAVADPRPFADEIERQTRRMGSGLVQKFRRVYSGSYETIPVKKIGPC